MQDWLSTWASEHPWLQLGILGALLLAGAAVGLLLCLAMLGMLRKRAESPTFMSVVLRSIAHSLIFWCALAGAQVGILLMVLPPEVEKILRASLLVLLVGLIALTLVRAINVGVKRFSKEIEGTIPITSLTQTIVGLIVFSIALLVVVDIVGVSVAPLLTAMGIGGLAIALALQPTLANIFSGIFMIASRQIQPGDFIQLEDGKEGYVEDVSWRLTRIKMLSNNVIVLPNSQIAGSKLINFNQPAPPMSLVIPVGVDYASDLDRVEKVTIEVATQVQQEINGAVRDHEPFIRFKEFGDSAILFNVILRVEEPVKQYIVRHEFIRRLKKRYDNEQISIPWPIRTLVWRDEGNGKKKTSRKVRA